MTTARALRGPFDYRLPEELRGGVVDVGSMLVVPFGRREVLGVVVGLADSSDVAAEKLLAPLRALELGVPAEMVELADWIAKEYCSTLARALGLVLPPNATRRLSGRKRRAVELSPRLAVGARAPTPPALNADQESVLASLRVALERGSAHTRLLHGVTGSGKTEVYLRAAETALAQDRGVIVLVPEIALTPQTVSRFVARFGDTVAVLHSQLRGAERYAEWRRLREGEARICVGPRSAVFAPIERLGLIVIDEEHESSYKHEGDPRYDARDVAAERARRSDAVLLLGSATPRAESAHRIPASRLPRRVDGRPLPPVEVLDMRGAPHGLHPQTAQALADVRDRRSKAIVLLNRRGWSNFLSCRSCGHVWSCPQCDVALVLHRAGAFLACHHCGHREPAPERCRECASISVARHGAGTERLQHELARVLDADATLRFPDFRAEERTFALIAQLAGRVGRGGDGRVLAQTIAPDARAILYAANHDSDGFLTGELERRRSLDYPPFSHLIRIVCSAEDARLAREAAIAVRERLRADAPPAGGGRAVLGPASLFRLRGREREALVVKAAERRPAVRAVGDAVRRVAGAGEHQGAHFSVDVDPQ